MIHNAHVYNIRMVLLAQLIQHVAGHDLLEGLTYVARLHTQWHF